MLLFIGSEKPRHRCQKLNFAHIFKEITFSLNVCHFFQIGAFWSLLQLKALKKRKEKDTKSKILMLQDKFETHFPKKANYKIE